MIQIPSEKARDVLAAIIAHGAPVPRTSVAKALKTNAAGITAIVAWLLEEQLVVEVERTPPRPGYAPLLDVTPAGREAVVAFATQDTPREAPAPVSGVRLSPEFAEYRRVPHPPIPQPGKRPAGMSDDEWKRKSQPHHSPLHSACARGTA